MVIRQTEFADKSKLDDYLRRLEDKGLPLFEKTLAQVDLDPRRKSITSYSRFTTQLEVIFLKYTLGHEIDLIKVECQKVADYLDYHLGCRNQPLAPNFGSYMLIVWALSTCYLFNVEWKDGLTQKIPFSGQDGLIDRLINCFDRSHIPTSDILFPNIYRPLLAALGQYQDDSRNNLLTGFLSDYLSGLKHYDAAWHDSHKEKDPRYYRHFGYWVFELGALVVDIDSWDDSEFREHPLYPKDLVDWRRGTQVSEFV